MAVVIGIGGGTAGGKSFLAKQLEMLLRTTNHRPTTVKMDKWFKNEKDLPKRWSSTRNCHVSDRNLIESVDWVPLRAELGQAAQSGEFDVVLLEGLFVLSNDELRKACDLKVFVETDDDVRVLRRAKKALDKDPSRALNDIIESLLESARIGHVELVAPSRRHADLVVFGHHDLSRAASLIAAWARQECASTTCQPAD